MCKIKTNWRKPSFDDRDGKLAYVFRSDAIDSCLNVDVYAQSYENDV